MKPSAVIFDLDGVLTDTAEFHYLAWKAIATRLGVDFNLDDNEKLKGVDRENSLLYILEKGGIAMEASQFKQLLCDKNEHYLSLIADINPNHLFAGVLSCFRKLKASNIKIGLASASKNAALVINKLGIEALFDYVGDAAVVTHSKPAPDIFLAVANGLKVAPEYCIGVEDAVAGVQAIKSANMFAVGIGDTKVLTQAELVFANMSELDLNKVLSCYQSNTAT